LDGFKHVNGVTVQNTDTLVELSGQRGGRADRLHVAREEAVTEHAAQSTVPYLELTLI